MILIWLLAAAAQCLLLFGLWRGARRIILQKTGDTPAPQAMAACLAGNVPVVAMLIPAAGNHPAMPDALRSLLRQDYPRTLPVIITATGSEPAARLARELREEFPAVQHVVAGQARDCGQKNHNTLRGLAHVGDKADIYMFCDSTHTARPDFVRQLAWPIAAGEAAFSTGYHQVDALDDKPVTVGYQICVLLMRLLQAVSVFTQPWGGAMAMSRRAFEQHGIADLWRRNVVDDCSLAGMLLRKRLHVRLCPLAILDTTAHDQPMDVWRAWMERQVLFLKFCVPLQWRLLGVMAGVMAAAPALSAIFVLGGLTGAIPPRFAWLVLAGAAHLAALGMIMLGWRELLPRPVGVRPWLTGFALSIGMFARVYAQTLRSWSILWHGIVYHVDKGGTVLRMERKD